MNFDKDEFSEIQNLTEHNLKHTDRKTDDDEVGLPDVDITFLWKYGNLL